MEPVRRTCLTIGRLPPVRWMSPVAVLLLLVSPFASRGASAADPSASPSIGAAVSVEGLVQAALEANPSIGAARAAVDAAVARSRVETAYANPSFTTTWWPEKESDRKQEMWELMLEQSLPFPGKLGAVRRARDAEEGASRVTLQRTIRDVTLRVRESAVELEYLRAAARIAAGNRELLGRLRAAGETGYAVGKTGLYDAMRAQAQESQTLFDERLLSELAATEAVRLNSLLSRPPETALGPIELHAGRPVVSGLADILERAASGRQEVLLAREDGKQARAERRVADFEALPELLLGVGYEQENALDDMEETGRWKFELGVTLPVNFGKNTARRAEAAAGEARALAMEREAGDTARAEVSENWFRLENAERLAALYRDSLLPQSVASLQLAETWYRAGQGSFADLVDAGTLWYTFQLALARASADREKYLARLEALAERPLTGPPATAESGTAVGSVPENAAWREVLARLEGDRAALEAEAASPLVEFEVLVPDVRRARELAPAAGDDTAAAAALLPNVALGDVEILAMLRNPTVYAAERSFRAALEQYGQVAALDDVVRRYASATGSLMGAVGGTMTEGTAARFPFPGMLALKGQIVAEDARAARAELGRARRDALAEARRLYWGLAYAYRAGSMLEEIAALQERTVQAVRSRYESGQGALADLTRAQVELEKTRAGQETVLEERRVLEAQLRALLALPQEAALGPPRGTEGVPAVAGAGVLTAVALERRQELRRMRAMATRMELMIQMAERETVPGFALGASLFENQPLLQDGTMAMREPFGSVGSAAEGAGAPLRAFSGRTAGYVRETRERLASLREEIRAEEQASIARVREARFAFDRAVREERLWSLKVGELTRLASETQDRSYRAGRASLPEALGAAITERESGLEAEQRRARVGEAWAALEAAIGGPLPGVEPSK